MRAFLKTYLNRYALFDTLVIAAAVGFGVFTGKIVYESRCEDTAAELDRLLTLSEAALAAHQHWLEDMRDTLEMLPSPPPMAATEDDR